MNRLRFIALLLVLLEAAIFTYTYGAWLTTVVWAGAAVLGVWGRIQIALTRERRLMLYLTLSVPFALWWVTALRNMTASTTILNPNLSLAAAQYFLALQVIHLFLRIPGGLPVTFPFYALITLMFTGDLVFAKPGGKQILFALYLVFAGLCAAYFTLASSHTPAKRADPARSRRILAGLTILLSVALAWSTARALEWAEPRVTQAMGALVLPLPEPGLGKDKTVRLGNLGQIKERHRRNIALRVYADTAPGYLRGNVYTKYEASRWTSESLLQTVSPALRSPEALTPQAGELLFPVQRGEAASFRSLEIWPESKLKTALFTPLDTAWMGLAAEQLKVDQYGIAEAAEPLSGTCYRPYTAGEAVRESLDAEARAAYISLPDDLDSRIRALAERLCAGKTSTMEKIAAVTQYFTGRYTYDLGITIPPGEDALTYFLFEEPPPPAHCEYFASGAAILLRAAGVPCRYVTGVMAWEKHPYADYWIARNRDAHAWVEAYDDTQGWVIVEATPLSGLPGDTTLEAGGGLGDLYDVLVFQMRRLFALIRTGQWLEGVSALVDMIKAGVTVLYTTWPGWIALALLALWAIRRVLRRRKRPRRKVATVDPNLAALGRILREMDRRVARQRLTRPPYETLHTFAERIAGALQPAERATAVAAWYRNYAEHRYGAPVTNKTVQALRSAMAGCWTASWGIKKAG